MDPKKIVDLTDEEVAAEIAAQTADLFKLRFQLATGQLENPSRIRAVRKHLARLKTAQRARELNPSHA